MEDSGEIERKAKRIRQLLFACNLGFYCLVLAWLSLVVTFKVREEWQKQIYVNDYASGFNKTVCAALLIYSLVKFRRQARAMDLQEYFGSEKLMSLHIVIFVCSILSYLTAAISDTASILIATQEESLCRAISSFEIASAITGYLNIGMEVLLIYLSVKFSKPLDDYRRQFLLMFQTSCLDRVESATLEYKKAKRYNKSAMEH